MKKSYSIGFFAAVFLFVFCLGVGYQLSYQYVMDRQEARLSKEQNEEQEELVTTKGEAQKNDGYYVMELHGYVAVYLSDKETLYETTEISMQDLPEEVQEEVRVGKYLETTRELYGFLENYSS